MKTRTRNQMLGLLGLSLALWLVFPRAAHSSASSAALTQKVDSPKPWWKKLSASVSLGSFLGTGSFAPAESYRNHYFGQALTMSASYRLWRGLYVGAGWGFDIEYTQPDNRAGRRFFPRDTHLNLGWNNPIAALQKALRHSIRLQVQLPTSLLAQATTRLLQLNLQLAASYNIKQLVTLGYAFAVTKGFHQFTSPIFDQSQAATPSVLLRQSTRDATSLSDGLVPLASSRNISWLLNNTAYVSVHFHKTVALTFTFGIFNGFRYPMPNDQYTPKIPTSDGEIQADTVGRVDLTMGDISLSWAPIKQLRMAVGATSLQSPFVGTNKGLRVPFLNLATPNDNTTTFYLSVTGSI